MNRKSPLRFYIRPALAITLMFVGVYLGSLATPQEIVGFSRILILTVAGLAFAVLGFNLPELGELIGRAGITAIAVQIMKELPREAAQLTTGQNPFSTKRQRKVSKYINPIVVDTSVFVDGRIVDIAKSGFLMGEVLVLPSVVAELHALSDSADALKRARGRRGLDKLQALKKIKEVKLVVLKQDIQGDGVDEKIISLASKLKARAMTTDFNLNKVARIKDVPILNVNELTNAVKTQVLPGEDLAVDIKAVGRAKDQGVGYLEDGTMVVVEGGAKMKGQNLTVRVMKVLQTAAGRMIFGKPKSD